MPSYVSVDLYEKHKDTILSLTNARQRYEPGRGLRGLTDKEIAERLGISQEEATEIRCIAELDLAESSRYFEADAWKEERREKADGGQKGP
jgi:DNA-directed RNA polymerase specialized sigma subunit